jgi:hypothetical protein
VRFFVGEMFVPQGGCEWTAIVGFWALSLVGIAGAGLRARKAGAVHDFRPMIDRGFHLSQGAEGAMTRTAFPDVMMLAGALALLAAVIALPLWW